MSLQLLENCTKETPEFTLCGQLLQGKVVECYDADTCKIVLPVLGNFYKFVCRLNGIDTPEMKPRKDKPNRDNEILWAKRARAELLKLISPSSDSISVFDNLEIKKDEIITHLQNNKNMITVRCMEFDKYGRLLVELFSTSSTTDLNTELKSFNQILVDKNMAVGYDGGKKINPWSN
jgi:endonuclease YncB( thermonuclease family)